MFQDPLDLETSTITTSAMLRVYLLVSNQVPEEEDDKDFFFVGYVKYPSLTIF